MKVIGHLDRHLGSLSIRSAHVDRVTDDAPPGRYRKQAMVVGIIAGRAPPCLDPEINGSAEEPKAPGAFGEAGQEPEDQGFVFTADRPDRDGDTVAQVKLRGQHDQSRHVVSGLSRSVRRAHAAALGVRAS